MRKKVMKLLNPDSGLMECRVCGSRHWANLQRGDFYHKDSWTCQYGCRLENSTNVDEFSSTGQLNTLGRGGKSMETV
jgi:hypothetical protein